jgi:hypothetical protein
MCSLIPGCYGAAQVIRREDWRYLGSMTPGRRRRSPAPVALASAALLTAACGVSNSSQKAKLAREELERVPVPAGYEYLGEGKNDSGEETFQYRLYAASRIGRHEPPSDTYAQRDLLPGFRAGWEVLDSWIGLSEDEASECLIVYERPTGRSSLDDLPEEAIADLGGRALIRLEAWCGDAQHSFD